MNKFFIMIFILLHSFVFSQTGANVFNALEIEGHVGLRNSDSIQAAINAAVTWLDNNGNQIECGAEIYIPSGEWIITDPIFLYSNIRIYGNGASTILKNSKHTNPKNSKPSVFVGCASGGEFRNIEIDHLSFRPDRESSSNINNGIIDFSNGMSNVKNISVHDCEFNFGGEGTGGADISAIFIASAKNYFISNIDIFNNIFAMRYCSIAINGHNNVESSGINIYNNLFLESGSFAGITISGNITGTSIHFNNFKSTKNSTIGIEFRDTRGSSVIGNTFQGIFGNPSENKGLILISSNFNEANGFIISNNTTISRTIGGMLFYNAQKVIISNNRFDLTYPIIFNGGEALVSSNWLSQEIARSDNILQTDNIIDSRTSRITNFNALVKPEGSTTSMHLSIANPDNSWRPSTLRVRATAVDPDGGFGKAQEILYTFRYYKGATIQTINEQTVYGTASIISIELINATTIKITANTNPGSFLRWYLEIDPIFLYPSLSSTQIE